MHTWRSGRRPRSLSGGSRGRRFFFSSRRRHTRCGRDWSSDVCSSDLQLAAGKGDGEILEWINANAKHKRAPWEIEQWSEFHEHRGPDSDAETLAFFEIGRASCRERV